MAIPELNTFPKYDLIIPSTKQKIKFRPFLVKEQKVLLMAFETKDKKSIVNAILDTLDACVEDVDIKKLSTFDVDFIFTQIRSKSVGEKVEVFMSCTNCEFDNPYIINLDLIQTIDNNTEKLIEITDGIKVKMEYPSYEKLLAYDILSDQKSVPEILMGMVYSSMESIETEDSLILLKDEDPKEIEKFVNSMTGQQFEKLSAFINDIPIIKYEDEFECAQCRSKNKVELEGLDDFF